LGLETPVPLAAEVHGPLIRLDHGRHVILAAGLKQEYGDRSVFGLVVRSEQVAITRLVERVKPHAGDRPARRQALHLEDVVSEHFPVLAARRPLLVVKRAHVTRGRGPEPSTNTSIGPSRCWVVTRSSAARQPATRSSRVWVWGVPPKSDV
jgi:hypothetical protein